MILYTNGCSWTWGGALEPFYDTTDDSQRLKLVWPHHLGQLLNAEKVVNLSMGCGSNQRAFRTTLDWINRQDAETLKDTLAIIQIIEPSRYEFYIPPGPRGGSWVRCKSDVVADIPLYRQTADWYKFYNDLNNHRLSTFTDEEGFYTTAVYCEALENLFRKSCIKYYLWFADFPPQKNKNYFVSRFPVLDPDKTWKYERLSETDLHPSIKGHTQIANLMFQKLYPEISQ